MAIIIRMIDGTEYRSSEDSTLEEFYAEAMDHTEDFVRFDAVVKNKNIPTMILKSNIISVQDRVITPARVVQRPRNF
ncbi:hypothetical protein [Buttiauxella sp.]|uniref:hypothetical protein n=1 Tax=Buttiauxella sp. TaxID=1972222 RepID=UPI003C77A2F7